MARLTGLEPATPGVTGRYSNQLSYNRANQGKTGPSVARWLAPATGGVKTQTAALRRGMPAMPPTPFPAGC